jgi:hypothetical protein
MGKKNHKSNDVASLLEQKKAIEKKIRQRTIPCSHTNKEGKIKGEVIKGQIVRCTKCGEEFSLRRFDKETLSDAISIVTDAINQCKAFSENPKDEQDVIEKLGSLAYSVGELPELYRRTLASADKHKKKKNHDRDNYSNNKSGNRYGHDTLLDTGKKKKKKYF